MSGIRVVTDKDLTLTFPEATRWEDHRNDHAQGPDASTARSKAHTVAHFQADRWAWVAHDTEVG